MRRYQAVIFDLDGTLLDTLEDLADGVNFALRRFEMPERTLDEVREFVGNGVRRLMELAVPQGADHPEFEKVLSCFKEYYQNHCDIKTKPYPQIPALLDGLKGMEIKLAIVSNKFSDAVGMLNRKYFGDKIGVSIGETAGVRKKPAPDTVLLALDKLGCSREDAVYIGDSEVDIQTARNAGMDCISVSWGFRDREVLEQNGAGLIFDAPGQLLHFLCAKRMNP